MRSEQEIREELQSFEGRDLSDDKEYGAYLILHWVLEEETHD